MANQRYQIKIVFEAKIVETYQKLLIIFLGSMTSKMNLSLKGGLHQGLFNIAGSNGMS